MATPGEEGGSEEGGATDTLDALIVKAQAALSAHGVNEPVAVYLAIDRSNLQLCNGEHCETVASRVMAFAAACGMTAMTSCLFSTTIDAEFVITSTSWSGVVSANNARLSEYVPGVMFEPMVAWVNDEYTESLAEVPAFVVVDTSGNPSDLFEADLAMTWSVAGWAFTGRGVVTESMSVLDTNWDFVTTAPTLVDLTDEQAFNYLAGSLAAALTSSS